MCGDVGTSQGQRLCLPRCQPILQPVTFTCLELLAQGPGQGRFVEAAIELFSLLPDTPIPEAAGTQITEQTNGLGAY